MTDMQSKKIQLLRGLAILAVVVIHNTPVGMTQVFVRPFLNFCVGMFLFLSGMLSHADRWKPWKRIIKVAIPYVIWTLIYVVMYNLKTPAQIPIALIKGLIIGNSSSIMYYIFVYCQFTLLIPLIHKLAASKFKFIGFLISPAEILILRLLPIVLGVDMHPYVTLVMGVSCLGWFTYFYLGYLLGNGMLTVHFSKTKLAVLWAVSIVLQILESYWYLSMGQANCATQMKLSCLLTGTFTVIAAYQFIKSEKNFDSKLLQTLGDHSFGIYFAHPAIMAVLRVIPYYSQWVIFPINAVIAILATLVFVIIGKKLLGKFSKYLAF